MPLKPKNMKTENIRFLSWLCCLPCHVVKGTVGSIIGVFMCYTADCCGSPHCCCQRCNKSYVDCGKIVVNSTVDSFCRPCSPNPLEMTADSIAYNVLHNVFSSDSFPHKQLSKLKLAKWHYPDYFDVHEITTASKRVGKIIYSILDENNLDDIDSTQLSKEDIDFISKELQHSLFQKIFSKEEFLNEIKKKNINISDADSSSRQSMEQAMDRSLEVNNVILTHLVSVMTPAFLFETFDVISDRLAQSKIKSVVSVSLSSQTLFKENQPRLLEESKTTEEKIATITI